MDRVGRRSFSLEEKGEEVEGRQAMNGRAVKLNRSREASEDPV